MKIIYQNRFHFLLFICLLALAFSLEFFYEPTGNGSPIGQISQHSNGSTIKRANHFQWHPVRNRLPLFNGDRLKTENTHVKVDLLHGVSVEVSPNTLIVFSKNINYLDFKVLSGSVKIKKRSGVKLRLNSKMVETLSDEVVMTFSATDSVVPKAPDVDSISKKYQTNFDLEFDLKEEASRQPQSVLEGIELDFPEHPKKGSYFIYIRSDSYFDSFIRNNNQLTWHPPFPGTFQLEVRIELDGLSKLLHERTIVIRPGKKTKEALVVSAEVFCQIDCLGLDTAPFVLKPHYQGIKYFIGSKDGHFQMEIVGNQLDISGTFLKLYDVSDWIVWGQFGSYTLPPGRVEIMTGPNSKFETLVAEKQGKIEVFLAMFTMDHSSESEFSAKGVRIGVSLVEKLSVTEFNFSTCSFSGLCKSPYHQVEINHFWRDIGLGLLHQSFVENQQVDVTFQPLIWFKQSFGEHTHKLLLKGAVAPLAGGGSAIIDYRFALSTFDLNIAGRIDYFNLAQDISQNSLMIGFVKEFGI